MGDNLAAQARGHVAGIAGEHVRRARHMVEANERVGHDEPALRKVGPFRRQRHGRLQQGHVVVAEVADDRPARFHLALGLGELDEPCACPDEAVTPQAPLLDRLEQEACAHALAQSQVGAQRGDQVGVDVGCVSHAGEKTLLAGVYERSGL